MLYLVPIGLFSAALGFIGATIFLTRFFYPGVSTMLWNALKNNLTGIILIFLFATCGGMYLVFTVKWLAENWF